MEEEMYYATLAILLQEKSTPQNWKNQEMAALIFFEGFNETKQESVNQKSIKHNQSLLHVVSKQNVNSVYKDGH
jgi:hypothetical protein